jgi:hypothetical protein
VATQLGLIFSASPRVRHTAPKRSGSASNIQLRTRTGQNPSSHGQTIVLEFGHLLPTLAGQASARLLLGQVNPGAI